MCVLLELFQNYASGSLYSLQSDQCNQVASTASLFFLHHFLFSITAKFQKNQLSVFNFLLDPGNQGQSKQMVLWRHSCRRAASDAVGFE